MLVGLHVPTNFLIYRQTLTLNKCMCMRASELRKFWNFYILNLLFLSIFCRYIRYFVGTNDMLVGSYVPTNFQMYRQKSEKALLGGGGGGAAAPPCPPPPPPHPPLATLMLLIHINLQISVTYSDLNFGPKNKQTKNKQEYNKLYRLRFQYEAILMTRWSWHDKKIKHIHPINIGLPAHFQTLVIQFYKCSIQFRPD